MSLIELTEILFQDATNKVSVYKINKSKELITPSIFAGINTISSLRALADYERKFKKLKHIKGVSIPLETINAIMSKCKKEERLLLDEKLRIPIPSTEMMYYKAEDTFQKIIRKLDIPIYNHFYINQTNLQKKKSEKINNFEKWLTGLRKDFFPFVMETLILEDQYSFSFYVPPATPIFNSGTSLDINMEINQLAEQYVFPRNNRLSSEQKPLATFLNFGSQSFLNSNETRKITNKIISSLDTLESDFIIFKIFNERGARWNASSLNNLKLLINDIQAFCENEEKLLMITDSLEIGQVLLYSGISIYSTPLNMNTERRSFKGGYVDKNKFKVWLRHYNEIICWEDYINAVEINGGAIIRDNYDLQKLKNLNRIQVANFRCQLRAENLNDDCGEWHQSIQDHDTRTAKIQLNNSGLRNFSNYLI
ncbi:MAG: hypothetical protein ACW99E_11785 [Promethearchaeota archaeon]|jgi:hypothetical protein